MSFDSAALQNLLKISPPKNFTGLHSHSSFSTFDGLGYPKDHIEFITSEAQGMDSWALTDHGNGSGLAHARAAAVKKQKSGKKYRQLYGVEFYFVPSLDEWQKQMDAHQQSVKDAKSSREAQLLAESPTIIKPADEDDEQGGHVIENEEETKESKTDKPEWKRYYHLVVIAKNRVGLGNLFTLVKKSFKHGFYRFPRIDYKMLKEHGEGLVVSTACVGGLPSSLIYREFAGKSFNELTPDLLAGPAAEAAVKNIRGRLDNMADRFVDCVGRDNFFLELQFNDLPAQHLTNQCLIELSQRTGLPLVATADSHFPSPDKWQARELYKKLGWIGAKLDKTMIPKLEDMKTMLYPKNAEQMWEEFKKGYTQYSFYQGHEELVRDAIERTHDIAWQKCEDTWVDTSVKLPIHRFENKTPFQRLVELAKDHLAQEGLADDPVYVERLKEELSDIKHLGHESYFLTMYEVFKRAEKRTLMGPGRGSAAGSLLNFLLGITQFDPLPYGLLWGRFLGRWRVSYPDIDTDAANRDILIDSARELYGDDAVIPVSNFNTLKLKSLLKDISKFYDVPFEEVNAMTGPLQDEVMPHARDDDQEKSVFVLKHEDCMKYSEGYRTFMEKYPDVAAHVETLFMENRSIGRHAGGVILADPTALEQSMPIISVRGELQTPWTEGMNFRNLEDNGFLKFDFLGLTLLKDVEDCIARILRRRGNKNPTFADVKAFFDEHINCRYHKLDDPAVYKHVYHQRRKTGVFQFTNEGARKLCEEARPSSIEEVAAITAIYRPGPLKANVHRKYIKAREEFGAGRMKFDHPITEEILGPTAGFLIYQEQFMELARRLGGFTNAESDQLRKTLVKKSLDTLDKKGSEKELAKQKFIEGAQKLHGLSPAITEPLWQTIDFMSVYCFNKSHSVSYAIDSYYAAWFHTHYETDWLATCLQSENNNPDGLEKTITEIKSYGYKFMQSDINYSGDVWMYSNELQAFIPPLSSVKGVGTTAMEEIMKNRPYKNLDDLLYDASGEWRHSKVNKTAMRSLCLIEAFSSLEELKSGRIRNHRQLLALLTDEKNYDTLRKGRFGMSPTQIKKLQKSGEVVVPIIDKLIEMYEGLPDWSRTEKLKNLMEMTSSVSNDLLFPASLMRKVKEKSVPSVFQIPGGTKGIGWFCVTEVHQKSTKNGKSFLRLRIIDNENNSTWLRCWGKFEEVPEEFSLWIGEIENDSSWGMSTSAWKIKQLKAFE
jgi:DNA polymerase-3 subunit alpha